MICLLEFQTNKDMTENLRRYNDVFKATFAVSEIELRTLKLKESENWDSVGHIGLISSLEDAFEIDMEPEDMFNISSYDEGLAILNTKYNIEF